MKAYLNLILIALFITTIQCNQKKSETSEATGSSEVSNTYTLADFKYVKKIDTHVHINTEDKTVINMARANNFRLLNIAVDVPDFPTVPEQVEIRVKQYIDNPDIIAFGTTFTVTNWGEPDWAGQVISQLKTDFANGATSVKIWKNIGMEAKDKNGHLIKLDDPVFDPVFKFIKDQSKVLLSHAGEPKNCWLPLDSMTVNNDRNYFKDHPQYHMYLHPEKPSYEELIAQRNNMLAKNPSLPFVGLHMGSMEWSVDECAKFLDHFPNASLDLAERISHTQYQSQKNREKIRNFFIKYQDRILYATDFIQNEGYDATTLENYMMDTWMNDWKYFNTDEMVTVPQLDTPVQGLALPKQVVDKIYRLNAEKLFPNAWK